jgi:hypothetical protein
MSCKLPNLVWRGPRGAGKRTALLQFLKAYAERLNQPFHLQPKFWQLQNSDGEKEISTTVDDTGGKDEKKGLSYEMSRIHKGFDVARMSLQDKNYIQTIICNFQGTSNILLGDGPGAAHILVFYHAHLLSEESVILIQEVLEKFSETVTFLFTSDYPLSKRLSDWFLEIPYPGPDRAYTVLREEYPTLPAADSDGQGDAWLHFFNRSFDQWNAIADRPWTVRDVAPIRQWIYMCMQRNLRWCDMILYWTQTVQRKYDVGAITRERAAACFSYLAKAPMGGGFVMLPSYRIPVAWEQFMIEFLSALTGC